MSGLGKAIREAAKRERRCFELVLGDFKLTMYSHPLTGADMDWLLSKHPTFLDMPSAMSSVDTIIRKAEAEDGSKLFTTGDRDELKRIPVEVLMNIRHSLFSDDMNLSDEAVEDAEKN